MRERRPVKYQTTLLRPYILTAGILIILSGCLPSGFQGPEVPEWPYPGGGINNSHYVDTVYEDTFTINKTAITESGIAPEDISLCLAGDLRGTKDLEIVIAGAGRIAVFDSDGERLLLKELPEYCTSDGLLHDIDDDGKQEIILGSKAAPRPELYALNGFGETVLIRQMGESSMDYSAVCPRAIHTGRLIVLCYPGSQSSPRGLAFLDPQTFRPLFMSMINSLPADMVFLRRPDGEESIVVSQDTYDQGIFKELGRRGVFRTLNDTELHLITLDTDGYLETAEVLQSDGKTLGGRGIFHPLGPVGSNTLLLVHTPRREEGDTFDPSLHVVDVSGSTILHSREFPNQQIVSYRVLPDASVLIVCMPIDDPDTGEGTGKKQVYVLDSTLGTVHTRTMDVEEITLGPSFSLTPERDRFGVLAWEDNRLVMMETSPPFSVDTLSGSESSPNTILFLRDARAGDGRVVAAGEHLEIFHVSRTRSLK